MIKLKNILLESIDNPAFKQWFAGSKVVDKNGNPLVLYHGSTKSDFTQFDTTKSGYHFGAGSYFTPDPDRASYYAKAKAIKNWDTDEYEYTNVPDGSNIRKVFVSIKNPFKTNTDAGVTDLAADLYKKDFPLYRKLATEIAKEYGFTGPDAVGTNEVGNRYLRLKGYDGVIKYWGWSDDDIVEVVAFHPNQIKSITGNKGTFDPKHPDITRQ